MTCTVICNDIKFNLVDSDIYGFDITLLFKFNGESQGMISFADTDCGFEIYKWFDEGKFPDFFDTFLDTGDNRRLRVVGVDDI